MYSENLRRSIQQLYSAGLHPIPLHPKSKRPKGNAWQTQERRYSGEEQTSLFSPQDNVGVICGDKVILTTSLDSVNKQSVPLYHMCADLDKVSPLVKSLDRLNCWVVKTGRQNGQGRHYHFLCDVPTKSRDIFCDEEHVGELKASGQVVSPPSIHAVSGLPYQTLSGSPGELPVIDESKLLELFPVKKVASYESVPWQPLSVPEQKESAIQKILVYCQRTLASAQYGERHNAIRGKAFFLGGFVGAGDLTREVAVQNLRMWTQALFGDEAPQEYKTIEDGLNAGAKEPIKLSELKTKLPEMSPDEWEHFRGALGIEPAITVEPDQEKQRDEIPDYLVRCMGAVGELADYMSSTAIRPQPYLAVGAALSLYGALLGKRVRTVQDTRTNLMMVGISGTASGKEHVRLVIRKLLYKANLSHHNPGDEVTSDSAIERVMQSTSLADSRALFLFDEWGDMCSGILAGDVRNRWSGGIMRCLMKFYSQANGVYLPKEYAKAEDAKDRSLPIEQPTLCIYGTTTPDAYFECMKSMHVVNGFLNRFVHLVAPKERPPAQSGVIVDPPQNLIDNVQRVANLPHNLASGSGQINPDLISPRVIPFASSSNLIIQEFEDSCDDHVDSGDPFAPMWGRAGQYAKQIALVLAGCEESAEIESKHILYGIEFIDFAVKRTIHCIKDILADNETEHKKKKLLRFLIEAKEQGLPKSLLIRKSQFLMKRERDDILSDLVDGGNIVFQIMRMREHGPEVSVYYAAEFAPEVPPRYCRRDGLKK